MSTFYHFIYIIYIYKYIILTVFFISKKSIKSSAVFKGGGARGAEPLIYILRTKRGLAPLLLLINYRLFKALFVQLYE